MRVGLEDISLLECSKNLILLLFISLGEKCIKINYSHHDVTLRITIIKDVFLLKEFFASRTDFSFFVQIFFISIQCHIFRSAS